MGAGLHGWGPAVVMCTFIWKTSRKGTRETSGRCGFRVAGQVRMPQTRREHVCSGREVRSGILARGSGRAGGSEIACLRSGASGTQNFPGSEIPGD